MAKKAKKRGVKPGTKRGPYKVLKTDLTEIDETRNRLRNLIKLKIKYLQTLLRKI